MSPLDLRQWAGRAVAWTVLLALVAVGYAILVAPIVQYVGGRQDQLEALETQLATYRTLALQRETWEAVREDANKGMTGAGLLLASGDPAVAQASSLARASDLATSSGLSVLSTESRPPETREGLARLPVVLRAEGSDQAIAAFLAAIANSRPLIIVDQVSMRVSASGSTSGEATRIQGQFTLVSLSRDVN